MTQLTWSNLEIYAKRETRALSQEVENNEKSMVSNEAMDYEEEVSDMDEDEGENDIVLIEEEYKSILDDTSVRHWGLSRKDFKFIKLIGSGAHAKVYLARKVDNQQLFAIKVLDKLELNKKKQINGTKIERRILVSLWALTNIFIGKYRKPVLGETSLCLSKLH